MVCPQRNWMRTWIFNSYIGVQLKKAAMYSGNVFVVNYVPRTHRVGPCNLQKQSFLRIFYDLDNVSTLYMYIPVLLSTDVFLCVTVYLLNEDLRFDFFFFFQHQVKFR